MKQTKDPLFAEMKTNPVVEYITGVPRVLMYPEITKEEFIANVVRLDQKKIKAEITKLELNQIPGYENLSVAFFHIHSNQELAKLLGITREFAFRNVGVGVGHIDIDDYDTLASMQQMIVVDTSNNKLEEFIVGGYRFQVHSSKDSYLSGPSAKYFQFTGEIFDQIWIELGRSFLNPLQRGRSSFDAVLTGIGLIYTRNKHAKGFLGKVTLPYTFEHLGARDPFLGTCKQYMQLGLALIKERYKVIEADPIVVNKIERILNEIGVYFKENYDQLNIVTIMMTYRRLTDFHKMYYFGAAKVENFGCATEFGFAIKYSDLYDHARKRFIEVWEK